MPAVITKTLSFSLCLILFVTLDQEIQVERATEEEARQVQEVANEFERRMRETRDVESLNDLFLRDYVRLQREEEKALNPGQSLDLIPSMPLWVKADLVPQVAQRDWERFQFAHFNFQYYFILLLVSRLKLAEIANVNDDFREKLYPAEVLALLRADPILRGPYGSGVDNKNHAIDTVEELTSLISTLEQVTLKLRQAFLKNPPEQTRIYQENLRHARKKEPSDSNRLIWPDLYGTRERRLGFPRGTRFFHRITADEMFELSLVKTDTGMKIVSARVYPFN